MTIQPTYSLGLTALPNGLDDQGRLRLSIYLSPSISTADNSEVSVTGSPFEGWTEKLQGHRPVWGLTFTAAPGGTVVQEILSIPQDVSALYPALWRNIFGAGQTAHNRKGNVVLQHGWRLSHSITQLHNRHRRLRYAHAQRALNASMARRYPSMPVEQLRGLHSNYNADVECSAPPVLYLYPTLQGDAADASQQVDDRRVAVSGRTAIDSAAGLSIALKTQIQLRVDYALDILETQEGERLQAPALYCIYRHCVASALPSGTSLQQASSIADASHPLYVLHQSFTNLATPLVPSACSANVPADSVDAYQHYVEMLLFQRRKADPVDCAFKTPDFHQLLGMVGHYPAMLRPLGLVFDIVVPIPGALLDGAYTVTVTSPFSDPAFASLKNQIASYATACRIDRATHQFHAASRDINVLDAGYLTLDGQATTTTGSAYSLVQEDADGSSLKLTDQAHGAARAAEYTSSAPTAMTRLRASKRFFPGPRHIVPTPASSANPIDAPAAQRTVGISLFHEDRLLSVNRIVNNAPPAVPAPGVAAIPQAPDTLYAEDLMLGIRVDIKHAERPWRSLCNRKSRYTIFASDGPPNDPGLLWPREGEAALPADEGFVAFAATQSAVDPTTTQTQIHQSMMTWAGWSLSLPKPEPIQSVNEAKPSAGCTGRPPLTIHAEVELPPGALLPALRFNDRYKIRCRVVDLAGNSWPCLNADTPHSLELNPLFSRHEPIRAPRILLTEPIDRDASPGENIDHLIARDGRAPATRILVPPRESLRLAELHGMLTLKDPLPGTAFENQNLMPDGSFPSVQQAHDHGWISDRIDKDITHNQDGIFLDWSGGTQVVNPFYPDPLAHYIRVKPYLVSDDPTCARLLTEPFYIEIDPRDEWPHFLATAIDLNAGLGIRAPHAECDNNPRQPRIIVSLPRGFTVVLEISSAGDNGENRPRRTDGSKSVASHQLHKTRMALLDDRNTPPRLLNDFFGSRARADQMRQRRTLLKQTRVEGVPEGITAESVLDDPSSYIDGDLSQMTPPRTMTFVHAARKPIHKPDFAPLGSAGDLSVQRRRGEARANIGASLLVHWLSTGKITCTAHWEDTIDDPTKDAPTQRGSRDVAFAITAADTDRPSLPDFDGTTYLRTLKRDLSQPFTDTRAHTVTYSLSAATIFRGYYPVRETSPPSNPSKPLPDEAEYTESGLTTRIVVVKSSARPPAPIIAYIVPAFLWRDTYDRKSRTWYSGRDIVARVYFERPFKLSGNRESVGVALATPTWASDEKTQPHVSRWGADPTRPIADPIVSSALTTDNLCEPGNPVQTCLLAEGGPVDIKPCEIHYAPDRKLWFSDIRINTLGALSPFLRLAFVRWQPQALNDPFDPGNPPATPVDPNLDCRISAVIMADFIQYAPDRWVSVQRVDHHTYSITVSGVFLTPVSSGTERATITLSLYGRWFAVGKDTGWRPIDSSAKFNYVPPTGSGPGPHISTWSTILKLPHSVITRKYRILLRENEWFENSDIPRVTYAQFVELP
jgi:hypothetical protein